MARERRRVGCGCIVAMLFLVAVISFAAIAFIYWSGGRQLRAKLDRLKERGQPLSMNDMESFYALDKSRPDVTTLYVDALKLLSDKNWSKSPGAQFRDQLRVTSVPRPGSPWQDEEAVRQALDQFSESLEYLHKAADLQGSTRYPVNFQGISTLLPYTQSCRDGASVLDLEAYYYGHQGDAHRVADSIHAMFALSESLREEPVLVSQLVRYAICAMAIDSYGRMLHLVEFSDEDLTRLQNDMNNIDLKTGVHRALSGERALFLDAYRNPGGVPELQQIALLRRPEDVLLYLAIMEDIEAAVDQPAATSLESLKAVDRRLKQSLGETPLGRVRYPFTAMMLPALDRSIISSIRLQTLIRIADTSVRLQRYKRKNGDWPESLKVLVPEWMPEIPTDPFDGSQIKMRRTDDAILLYSIGPDRVDNGGVKLKDQENGSDIVVEIPTRSGP